jgi:hypothetical protein
MLMRITVKDVFRGMSETEHPNIQSTKYAGGNTVTYLSDYLVIAYWIT